MAAVVRPLRWLLHVLLRPSLVGAAYVLGLALWAARSLAVNEQEAGAQAHQIDALIHGRFAGEIARISVAVASVAVLLGALLGCGASALLSLRDWLHPDEPRRSPLGRAGVVLVIVACLQAALELWGLADCPSLYVETWYARGGWRRAAQVIATDVLGCRGVVVLVALVC
ncbi:MAG: hypothetical protein M3O50_14150, partial [Myxococcota bacterium]|nr:hypothetical protein [Myxococcota bacterium]